MPIPARVAAGARDLLGCLLLLEDGNVPLPTSRAIMCPHGPRRRGCVRGRSSCLASSRVTCGARSIWRGRGSRRRSPSRRRRGPLRSRAGQARAASRGWLHGRLYLSAARIASARRSQQSPSCAGFPSGPMWFIVTPVPWTGHRTVLSRRSSSLVASCFSFSTAPGFHLKLLMTPRVRVDAEVTPVCLRLCGPARPC